MSNFYQRLVAIVVMAVLCIPAQAQKIPGRTDRILKLDKTAIDNVVVMEVNKTEIRYKDANATNNQIYIISRKDIWRIEWNNGEKEEINPIVLTPAAKPLKPTDLLVKRKTITKMFWENEGAYWGINAIAGSSNPVKTPTLATNRHLAYGTGLTLGYHKKSVGIQLEALYTQIKFDVQIPPAVGDGVNAIQGLQSQVLLPLNLVFSRKFGKTRLGGMLGGFGAFQAGMGSLKVDYPDGKSTHTRNCPSCSDKGFGYGVTGGIGATLLETSFYTFYINARYYHSLSNNEDYKIGETGVKNHAIMINGGVLFHFSK